MFLGKIEIRGKEFHLRDLALCLAMATIPFNININSWALTFFCVFAFLESPWKEIPGKLAGSRLWMISAAYFLWLALSFFWDTSGGFTIKDLERYGTFLVFPFVFTFIPRIPYRVIAAACMVFTGCIVVVSVICLTKSYLDYQVSHDSRVFFYHYLAMQMDLNAVILSNFCLESMAWTLYFSFRGQALPWKIPRWIVFTTCAFLFFMLFLLSSKLIIFLFLLLSLVLIMYYGYKFRKIGMAWLLVAFLLAASVVLIYKLPYLRWRIASTELKLYQNEKDNQNGLAARLIMWNSAMELIKARPVLGYGLVGSKQELFKKYAAKDFALGYSQKYNVHNQFLEIALTAGLAGLLIFLLILGILFYQAIRKRNYLLLIILIHFLLKSLFESTLEVQQDIVFFFFFIFLFYYELPVGKAEIANPKDQDSKIAGLDRYHS